MAKYFFNSKKYSVKEKKNYTCIHEKSFFEKLTSYVSPFIKTFLDFGSTEEIIFPLLITNKREGLRRKVSVVSVA